MLSTTTRSSVVVAMARTLYVPGKMGEMVVCWPGWAEGGGGTRIKIRWSFVLRQVLLRANLEVIV